MSLSAPPLHTQLTLVGGGLSGGLLALALRQFRPDSEFVLLEGGDRLGGQHTWSFHETDLDPEDRPWILPLVSRSWDTHRVSFLSAARTLPGRYHSIRSEDFHRHVSEAAGSRIRFREVVRSIGERKVDLADGGCVEAQAVVDARGMPSEFRAGQASGWQKFVGLDLELEEPHGLSSPHLMDATVEQKDGFRFVYVLPWDERRLLVEDTRYSDTPGISLSEYEAEIRSYCASQGWKIRAIERTEQGSLPIPLDSTGYPHASQSPPAIGMRAGLFHPTTGYSLPAAARLARRVASLPEFSSQAIRREVESLRSEQDQRQRFFFLLNRMLFRAALPEGRRRVFETFYRHSDDLISRFYAGKLTRVDEMKILFRFSPPVPVASAFRCLFSSSLRSVS